MSTTINITVGDDALLNRAQQQQSANRQAQLEREATARLQKQATETKTDALAAAGKDAAGNSVSGSLTKAPQLERRPAANRRGGSAFLLVPSADYTSFGFEAKTKNIKATTFTNIIAPAPLGQTYTTFPRPEYVATGGPADSSFLRTPAEFEGVSLLTYVVCDTPGTQGIRFINPLTILTSSGEKPAQQIKKPPHLLTSYTVECYLQANANGPVSGITSFLSMTEFFLSVVDVGGQGAVQLLTGEFACRPANGIPNSFSLRLIGADRSGGTLILFGFDFEGSPVGTYVQPDRLNFGGWYHIAYVRNKNVESFYFEGKLITTQTTDLNFLSAIPKSALTRLLFALTTAKNDVDGRPINPIVQPGIHGFRFTPKALYSDDFVPPPKLTTLA
jgi:hypothetical protein